MSKSSLKIENKIPHKLSEAIVAATNDLVRIERSKKYRVNMHRWHEPVEAEELCTCSMCVANRAKGIGPLEPLPAACEVCFAGALISGTGEVSPDQIVEPNNLSLEVAHAMSALDEVRKGKISQALVEWPWFKRNSSRVLNQFPFDEDLDRSVPIYSPETKGQFKRAMRKIARELAALGV